MNDRTSSLEVKLNADGLALIERKKRQKSAMRIMRADYESQKIEAEAEEEFTAKDEEVRRQTEAEAEALADAKRH